jgi:hypothetical protein
LLAYSKPSLSISEQAAPTIVLWHLVHNHINTLRCPLLWGSIRLQSQQLEAMAL